MNERRDVTGDLSPAQAMVVVFRQGGASPIQMVVGTEAAREIMEIVSAQGVDPDRTYRIETDLGMDARRRVVFVRGAEAIFVDYSIGVVRPGANVVQMLDSYVAHH